MSEILFILGAGASKEAGAPLMSDFLEKADELYRKGQVDEFSQDFKNVFEAISNLQVIHSKAELDLDNIESVFAAFEMGKLINRLPGIESNEIDGLLLSIKRLILKVLEKTIKIHFYNGCIQPNKSYNSLAKLVNNLNEEGRRNRCSIITFNYDLALDYSLHFNCHPADYCLTENTKQGYTQLMKLHGSLNWVRCSKCNKIIPWEIGQFFKRFHYSHLQEEQAITLDLPSKLPSSDIKCCGENVTPLPVIIPPTWNKTTYHQNISEVWKRAAKELSDAENIFVSGYSLTESDAFFRYLFALGSEVKTRIKRFWVFDPDEPVEQGIVRKRFKGLIGPGIINKFSFENKTFSDLIGEISNIKF